MEDVSQLDRAIRKNDLFAIDLLLKKGLCVNRSLSNGDTYLHIACRSGNIQLVTLLLHYGAKQIANEAKELPQDSTPTKKREVIARLLKSYQNRARNIRRETDSNLPSQTINKAQLDRSLQEYEFDTIEVFYWKNIKRHDYDLFDGMFFSTRVLLKRIKPHHNSATTLCHDKMELKVAGSFSHPQLLKIYGLSYDPKSNFHYRIMEKPSIGFLSEHKKDVYRPGQSIDSLLMIARDISYALMFLNKNGFYHDDIRSENIALFGIGKAKLANFDNTKEFSCPSELSQEYNHSTKKLNRWKLVEDYPNDITRLGFVLWSCICEKPEPLKFNVKVRKSMLEKIPSNIEPIIQNVLADCWNFYENQPTSKQVYNWLQNIIVKEIFPDFPSQFNFD